MKKTTPKRTIFIGDVHGCLTELKKLIEKIDIKKEDEVIILGDLINRGPFSKETIKFVYKSGYQCLMGNHDVDYVKKWDKKKTYQEIKEYIGEQIHEWYIKLPYYIVTDDYLAVHAGIEPNKTLKTSKKNLLYSIRTWDGTGEDVKNEKNPPWYYYYKGKKPVFYGHWAKQGIHFENNTYCLDSGCVYGKKLSAYILEENKLVQVKSKKKYKKI